jgi:hypothetical protein
VDPKSELLSRIVYGERYITENNLHGCELMLHLSKLEEAEVSNSGLTPSMGMESGLLGRICCFENAFEV